MSTENPDEQRPTKSSNGDKKGCFGCLGVILIFVGIIYFIFKPATDKDQEWSRNVKAEVPSGWTQISESNSSIELTNPLTWGDKGVGQVYYLLDAERINSDGDWLVHTAFIRREFYEYDPGVKTDLGYVSKGASIINFDKMEAIVFLEELPEYKGVDKFTRSQALRIIREEKFWDAYEEGARDIKKAIDSRR